ncbi:DUF2567 domain-containing protein [Gordonia sp. SMJS1]|uniref:DUF2567 domain-containing protein n=1 Tax=Gordonia sp. SMJS1 TaxID=3039400 RepID=UPI0024570CAB|nr:DUF2567 domain-containing protein [Gordonia sp. SMJS1]WGJ84069.1 DUF2567 domain-containing protein [Gordonia sp. SMJS1]
MTPRVERPVSVLVAMTVAVVLMGAIAGMVWGVLTPPTTGVVVRGLTPELVTTDFGGVAAFALTMFGYGAAAALVVWIAVRAWRGVVGFLVPVLGTVAGSAVAAETGMWLAGMRFDDDVTALPVSSVYEVAPELWLEGGTSAGYSSPWILLICAPFAFAIVYLVCVLSARTADLGVGDLPDDPFAEPAGAELTSGDAASRTRL